MKENFNIAMVIIVILFGLNIYQYLKTEEQNKYLSKSAYASSIHPIDIEVQKCMKKENYTTGGMSYCVAQSNKKWEKEIEKSIKELKKYLKEDEYKKLLYSEQKWEEYKKAKIELLNETYLKSPAHIYINYLSGDVVNITEERAYELSLFLERIKQREGTFLPQ